MIAVDSSALFAILLDEAEAKVCAAALKSESTVLMSAGTLSETLVVATARRMRPAMIDLVDGLEIEVLPLTKASALRVAEAYERWGKGTHPANLNWGDCFAYSVAKEYGCPLLYVGKDFAKTDIKSALK
jgi:ribonuclease VapC